MHPHVMAALAAEHQSQLLRDAATRRRAVRATRGRTPAPARPVTYAPGWVKNLAATFRPAPEPRCC